MAKQFDYNSIFASDITALKAAIENQTEVLNLMDWAIESALDELTANGHLDSEASLLEEYRAAIKVLRQRGFKRPRVGQEGVTCPGCKAVLKDVSGQKGERCSWCGYEFK
ncbi:MAG: hypothetical protein QM765_04995 [Myxococcales bacterium]